ncbi:Uncharacterised protein [Amycolatopsis camponoti]|uniref:Uncharacterized protein n=1 Tax=Amycolatopsis camponoti TaxID=2606593 RepID=A0A6I8M4E2_9PSEU|nr:Uncharacterised protein [Amycolatopsis camponoti]
MAATRGSGQSALRRRRLGCQPVWRARRTKTPRPPSSRQGPSG